MCTGPGWPVVAAAIALSAITSAASATIVKLALATAENTAR